MQHRKIEVTVGSRKGMPAPLGSLASILILLGSIAIVGLLGASPQNAAHPSPRIERLRTQADSLLAIGRFSEAESLAHLALTVAEETTDKDSTTVAQALIGLVDIRVKSGQALGADTRGLAERAVQINRRALDPEHPDLAGSLSALADVLYGTGDFEGAVQNYRLALGMREKTLPMDDPRIVQNLSNLGDALTELGDYPTAKQAYERGLLIVDKAESGESMEVAEFLCSLGDLLRVMGDHNRSKAILERSVLIIERLNGPEDPGLGICLHNLSITLTDMGKYSEALRVMKRALAIREKALGPSPELSTSLASLGMIELQIGDYSAAGPLLERAVALTEQAYPDGHPYVARCMSFLAIHRQLTGDYDGARVLLERALVITERTLSLDHPDAAAYSTTLGGVLHDIGDYAAAMPVLKRALVIQEKIYGPDHRMIAITLSHLAEVAREQGDLAAAAVHLERAVRIHERAHDPDHPELALVLGRLGSLRRATNDYAAAESLLTRAVSVLEKDQPATTPKLASSLTSLAVLLSEMGQYARAESLHSRALSLDEQMLGPSHSNVANDLANLAVVRWHTGKIKLAVTGAKRAEEIGIENLRFTVRSLPERQALGFAAQRSSGLNLLLSAAATFPDSVSVAEIWNAAIQNRGLVLDEMAQRHRAGVNAIGPDSLPFRELMASRSRLANLTFRGLGSMQPEVYRQVLDEATRAKEVTERAMASVSARFRLEQTRGGLGLKEVAMSMPPNSALVGFYLYAPLASPGTPPAKQAPVKSYVAFVLRTGDHEPVAVRLGAAAPIDSMISEWRDAISEGFLANAEDGVELRSRRIGAALRRATWDRVAAKIGDVGRVFLVPDGSLNLIDFGALPTGELGYLVEMAPVLHYESAERDMVPEEPTPRSHNGLLALGGVDFDLASPHQAPGVDGTSNVALRGQRSDCETFANETFDPLPGTRAEVERVVSIWKKGTGSEDVLELRGRDASETAVKSASRGRAVIHLATHGFFLDEKCMDSATEHPPLNEVKAMRMENPLLRSGVVLAGANRRQEANSRLPDDGILTAEEVASLDLIGVEWVVLSGCDTGRGSVAAGEGVLGLRRAFEVAGAKTLIMSLWRVSDQVALEWNRRLYQARWGRGLRTAESVKAASVELLRTRRERGQSTNPATWAGFIAAGDWR